MNTDLYEVGYIYKTKSGSSFLVVGEYTHLKGYETVYNQYHKNRYNRTTHNTDNGRTTGSPWTENCLEYPPVKVGKINMGKWLLLKVMSFVCKHYNKFCYKYFDKF